jgi:hypothetical protein
MSSQNDLSSLGSNCLTSLAHHSTSTHFGNFHEVIHPNRPKNDNLGANSSIFIPVANPVRMYSNPSASVR